MTKLIQPIIPKLSMTLLLLLGAVIAMAQENVLENPVKQLNQLRQKQAQEKLYLHTDRSGYVAGDRVWFNAYLVDATSHTLLGSNTIAYVELINQDKEIILKRYTKITNGTGVGDFKIPFDQPKGEYLIRAYTRHMQNFDVAYFFTKKIKVLSIKDASTYRATKAVAKNTESSERQTILRASKKGFDLDMQFFPEGGHMLDKLANQVAFKAVDHTGKGVALKGKIVDQQGQVLTLFNSVKFGLGKFILIPQSGQSYTAVIIYKGKKYGFALPKSEGVGYKMQVSTTNKYIQVMSEVSKGYSIEQSSVVAHLRGRVISKYTYQAAAPGFVLRIPKKDLPSGIVHLTLFDAQKVPQCERLIFVEHPADLQQMKITSGKTAFTHRKKATFDLELKDATGKPIQGKASLAVVRTDLENDQMHKMNIQNYLWLRADLKGHIENPAYYFNKQHKDRHQVMDLLMMTQGWRRFKWNDMHQLALRPLKYQREHGFTIQGRLFKSNQAHKLISGKVQFLSQQDMKLVGEVNTNKEGRFVLRNVPIEDTTNLVFRGIRLIENKRRNKVKERKNNIFVKLDEVNALTSPVADAYFAQASPTIVNKSTLLERTYKINRINAVYGLEPEVMQLKEVKIVRSRPARILSKLHMSTTNMIDFTKLDAGILHSALSIFDVLRNRVPQLTILGTFPFQSVAIRGGNPMLLLDNTPVSFDMLSAMPVEDIAYVDVLSTGRAAIYGSRGFNGVLAVYTKERAGITQESNIDGSVTNMFHPGYSKAREFYVPKYDVEKISKDQLDYRRILYWKPNITLDKNGKAQVTFFTSDESANYRIEVEGVTQKGKAILGTHQFEVR